ncbi:MAG: hypothetical protein D6694_04685 [Gammaproteobacteria bacterium]|nr:MAG: hypothetical protein D6694_04685 [Gammaproteobacteria bacterium]
MAKGKHPGGRPKKLTEGAEIQAKIDTYFAECAAREEMPTITGLALALDVSPETLRVAALDGREFSATIKKAKARVVAAWEQALVKGSSGAIFWLKNCARWRDKQEIDHTHRIEDFLKQLASEDDD